MRSIFSYWHFDPMVVLFLAVLCFAYLYVIRFKVKKQSLYFFCGIGVIILCVASPLHFLGEHYLFSAHMISHVLLLLIAAPLLVAGIPGESKLEKLFHSVSTHKLKITVLCWFTGVAIMWLWHIPVIFNKAAASGGMGLMYVQWLSLLIGGIIFCLPVISPDMKRRISPLTAVLYLSTACVFCTILGLMITFAPIGIYSHYVDITDQYGYLNIIRNQWKISTGIDQQAAGLIMWVPCCFIYLTASMIILINWFDKKEVYNISQTAIINN